MVWNISACRTFEPHVTVFGDAPHAAWYRVQIALGMMVVGGLTYSYNDLHYDGVGYL